MDTAVQKTTRGLFHYVDPAEVPSWDRRFNFDPQWSGIPVLEREMQVTDVTALPYSPSLEREGFQILQSGVDVLDCRDMDHIDRVWRPAVVKAVLALTGADAVASWGLGARFSERRSDAPRTEVSNPARRVHSDFAPSEFGGDIVHGPALEAIATASAGRKPMRWHGLNVWQTLSPPPYDTPLALCDRRSLSPGDLVVGRGSAPSLRDLELDLPLYAYSPHHRWYYWSRFNPGEALIFSGLDSEYPGDWHLVPHSAFDDPTCPTDASPRESAEMRLMALFFE